MRITGHTPLNRPQGVQPRAGGAPAAAKPGGPASSAATSGVGALASLSMILSVQGVDDALEGRRRAARRGAALLDGLDDLRLALLDGTLSPDLLPQLRRHLAGDGGEDAAVLAEIELRVEVELAKIECALDRAREE